jgi:hypothetical protein
MAQVIIGRCEHGKIVSAAIDGGVSRETLEDMACSYTLERADEATFDGECSPCRTRYVANMKLLGFPVE